jgi:hypothetical protein
MAATRGEAVSGGIGRRLWAGGALVWAFALAACGAGAPLGPTYQADVKPLVEQRCQSCHVEGGIAPFALTTYDDVYDQRMAIKAAVAERRLVTH